MATAPATSAVDEVRAAVSPAGLGTITLCREKQLNALGAEHVEAIRSHLLAWLQPDAGVKCVLMDSSTDRSFCSGGDVKAARQAVLDHSYADVPPPGHHIHRVFQSEYSTVLLTAAHPSLVAVCQGIWMGFGFGIAGFAPHRVVSDGTVFAMPENAIGLWPDVGFAFKAAHMPGHAGLLLGLTGVRLSSPADLLHFGIATHYIPAAQLHAFKSALAAEPSALQALLQQHSRAAPDSPGPLQRLMPVLDPLLQQLADAQHSAGCEEVQAMQQLLHAMQQELHHVRAQDHQAGELLQHAINGLAYACPRSLAVMLHHFCAVRDAVRRAAGANGSADGGSCGGAAGGAAAAAAAGGGAAYALDIVVDGRGPAAPDLSTLQGVMEMEYRMATRQVAHQDFIEGVRAALVDKDRRPAWLTAPAATLQKQQQQQQQGKQQTAEESRRPGNRFSVAHLFAPLP